MEPLVFIVVVTCSLAVLGALLGGLAALLALPRFERRLTTLQQKLDLLRDQLADLERQVRKPRPVETPAVPQGQPRPEQTTPLPEVREQPSIPKAPVIPPAPPVPPPSTAPPARKDEGPTPTPPPAEPPTHARPERAPGPSEVASSARPTANRPAESTLHAPRPKPAAARAGTLEREPPLTLETRIGSVWATRIGLVVLAIGVAYLANLVVDRMQPWHKTALAYLGAVGLFTAASFYEDRLKQFARPVMAGSLALGYFISFAAHFIESMRCVPLGVGLAWMAVGVLLLFFFANRWQSQCAAGLAIFLGHVAAYVAADKADVFSLVSIAFLAALAAVLYLKNAWPTLSLFAAAASYGAHFAWFILGHDPTGEPITPLQFWLNLGFLSSYYAIFATADVTWWARASAREASADAADSVSRAMGPVNVVLYAAFASFLYVLARDVEAIYQFFLALAAVQVVLFWAQRRSRNADAELYVALAVIFGTLGVFSYFEDLALNQVLAAEALVLFVAAHVTRLWVFHALAQIVLLANFAHYWLFHAAVQPTPESSAGVFIGGLMVAGVYLLKAHLEERWYGPEVSAAEWASAQRGGPIMQWLGGDFNGLFSVVAPQLAFYHAVAGPVILMHQVAGYFTPTETHRFLPWVLLLLPAVACIRRSSVLLLAYLVTQFGTTALAAYRALATRSDGVAAAWREWWLVAAGWLAATAVTTAWPYVAVSTKRRTLHSGLLFALAATGLASITAVVLAPRIPPEHVPIYLC